MISPLFKLSFLLVLFLCKPVMSEEHGPQYFFEIEQRLMEDDWSFLPDPPDSFESSRLNQFLAGVMFEDVGIAVGYSNLELDLLRNIEPKDVSLSADKTQLKLFYNLDDSRYLRFSIEQQKANEQRFDCYAFRGVILGNCPDADLQVGSTNPKYDDLDGSLISLIAETKSVGLDFVKEFQSSWLDELSIGIASTKHDYHWMTPIEDIASPFLLGLTLNGVTLGELIAETLMKLPQRDPWKLHQLNLDLVNTIPFNTHFAGFYEVSFRYFKFEDYNALLKTPKSNMKLRLGLRWTNQKIALEVFGDVYQNNIIGFESISFNQRTEHHFDRVFGEVGLKFTFATK
mgnify:FL=1